MRRSLLIYLFFLISSLHFASAQTLNITKMSNKNVVQSGERFTYRLLYSCAGQTGNCTGVKVEDVLPPELEFIRAIGNPIHTAPAGAPIYDPGTHKVTFNFIDPLPAGSTGELKIRVRFKKGITPNNTTVTNRAQIISNEGSLISNPVDVTSLAQSRWYVAKSGGTPVLDQNFTYTVSMCSPSGDDIGGLNLNAATLVDNLPAGAVYVTSSGGGIYNMGSHTVTWNLGNLAVSSGNNCTSRTVTVRFPSSNFNAGDYVTNQVCGWGTPVGEANQLIGCDDVVKPLTANPSAAISKERRGEATIGGGNPSYWLNIRNNGNVPLANFIVRDTMPAQLDFVELTTGAYNSSAGNVTIRYYTNTGASGTLGTNNWGTNTTYSAPTLGGGQYVHIIEYDFGSNVPAGFAPSTQAYIAGDIINPDHNSQAVNVGDVIRNCATLSYHYDGANYRARDCGTVRVLDEIARIEQEKSIVNPKHFVPGDTVEFRLFFANHDSSTALLHNPIVLDLLPDELIYVPGSANYADYMGSGAPNPIFTQTPNYNGTGRVLLKWEWTAASAYSFPIGTGYEIYIKTVIAPGADPSTIVNEMICQPDGPCNFGTCFGACGGCTPAPDVNDLDGDGDTTDLTCSFEVEVKINPIIAHLELKKSVLNSGPFGAGDTICYQIEIGNEDIAPADLINPIAMDLLPEGLDFIAGAIPTYDLSASAGAPIPSFEAITSYNGTSRTLLRWEWIDAFAHAFPADSKVKITFKTLVNGNAPLGDLVNVLNGTTEADTNYLCVDSDNVDIYDLDGDGKTNEDHCKAEAKVEIIEKKAKIIVEKDVITPEPYLPHQIVEYKLKIQNDASATGNLVNPVLMDLLPFALLATDSPMVFTPSNPAAPIPSFEKIDNYNATGRTLLRWTWQGTRAYAMAPGESYEVTFKVKINPIYGGPVSNQAFATTNDIKYECADDSEIDAFDLDGDGDNSDLHCTDDEEIEIIDVELVGALESEKLVKGQKDTAYSKYPETGLTVPGGIANYQLYVTNNSNVPMDSIVVIDILPFVGDQGLIDTSFRNTQWRPFLVSPVLAPPGVTVYYSTESYPCRPELGFPAHLPSGCQPPNWTTDLSSLVSNDIKSMKFDFGNTVLGPGDQFLLEWEMRAPTTAPTNGEIAWNSFGYVGRRADNGDYLLPSEPFKVGIEIMPVIPAAYGDYVWFDLDEDGIQDPTEIGVKDVRVELYRDNGDGINDPNFDTFVGFTATDSIGQYLFPNVAPGDYYAVFYIPPTYATSPIDQGGNDMKDSDGTPAIFGSSNVTITAITTLDPGEFDYDWDQGIYLPDPPKSAVGNYVWHDVNNDGIQNESALEGLNGVTVSLYNATTSILIGTQVTANDLFGNPGYYLFDMLDPGAYYIQFDLPPGGTFTSSNVGTNDTIDSDPNNLGQTASFILGPNEMNPTLDAGIFFPEGDLTLGNRVFEDMDNDGIYDRFGDLDRGINGVRVNLYQDTNLDGMFTPGVDQFLQQTVTYTKFAEPGYYEFPNLFPGEYIVQLDSINFKNLNPLVDFFSSTGNGVAPDPDDDLDNDDNGDEFPNHGIVSKAITLIEEPVADGDGDDKTNMTVDFGVFQYASLGNYVWFDNDADGIQDGGELGIEDVIVSLYDNATSTLIGTTKTDVNGLYLFDNLEPGKYFVIFDHGSSPLTHAPTLANVPSVTDDFDSDADPITGKSPVVMLSSNEYDPNTDAGYYPLPIVTYCPADKILENDEGICGAIVTFDSPRLDYGNGFVHCGGLYSGDVFPVGKDTICYAAIDLQGNLTDSICRFIICVLDTEKPKITCPDHIVVNTDLGNCSSVVNYDDPLFSDNCAGASLAQTGSNPSGLTSGSAFPVGISELFYTATDTSGNQISCSFTVEVLDNENPKITCPDNIITNNDPGNCEALINFNPTTSDNCPGESISSITNNSGCDLNSGSIFPIGTTEAYLTVIDKAGNIATCSFSVTVNDNEAPTITCPIDIITQADAGICETIVNYPAPEGDDNCQRNLDLAQNLATSTMSNNILAQSFTPSVSGELTQIDVNIVSPVNVGYLRLRIYEGEGMIGLPIHTQNIPVASLNNGLNNLLLSLPVSICNSEKYTFSLNYSNGNQIKLKTCNYNCYLDGKILTFGSRDLFFRTYMGQGTEPVITQTDGTGLTSGDVFPVGMTQLEYTIEDGYGNSTKCDFDVTVQDNEDPTINCPADVLVSNDATLCTAVVNYNPPVGNDNCPNETTVLVSGLTTGSAFPVGETTVIYSVEDAAGNVATCSFNVTVEDNEDPTINCPADVLVSNDATLCSAVVNYNPPVGNDNCPNETTVLVSGLPTGSAFPVGETTVIYSVEDASGNIATCSFKVTIEDNEDPTINCPADVLVSNDSGNCTAVLNYNPPVGNDNCPNETTVLVSGLPSGSAFPVGETTVIYSVEDASGNVATCSFKVTVQDNEAPTINCPANVLVSNDAGLCSAIVNYNPPTGTDNCPNETTILVSGLPSGSAFPVGETEVIYQVEDASGNIATCSFVVEVQDVKNPTINCPNDVTVGNDLGNCDAIVNYNPPTGTDNCPNETTTLVSGLSSGSAFPVGKTTVMYSVEDASGNLVVCSFEVEVEDTENPVVVCPNDITVNSGIGACNNVVSFNPPNVSDNCGLASIVQVSGLPSGSIFPMGTSTIVFEATDIYGNKSTCSFTITIKDTDAPSINCISDLVQSTDLGRCDAIVTYQTPSDASNCPGQTITRISGLPSGSVFPLSVSTIVYQAIDQAGNIATCSFKVTVQDNEDPTINCPADVLVSNDATLCTAIVNYNPPVGNDNCPNETTAIVSGLPTGSNFPVGETTIVYSVIDASGNIATCSFKVTVEDTENPVVICPNDITVNLDLGNCSNVVSFNPPNVSDNCGIASIVQISGLPSGSNFPMGTSSIEFEATDIYGNVSTCSFTVTIKDTDAPSINCSSNLVENTDLGRCDAVVTYQTPSDASNCPGQTITRISGLPSGSIFPLGISTIVYQAIDQAGNIATCSFKITILDNEIPSLNCSGNIFAGTDIDECDAIVTYDPPAGADNCPNPSINFISGFPSGSTFPLGTTNITFEIEDAAGNITSCNFDVTVEDNQPPTFNPNTNGYGCNGSGINCPADMTVCNDIFETFATVTYNEPCAVDNCPNPSTNLSSGLPSGSAFPLGRTENCYIGIDASGNTVECCFEIYVKPTGSIGDTTWVDSNGDGIQDLNEPAKSGIVVELFDANTSTSLGTTITNANGFYQFTNLPAGDYYLEFTDPAGICIPTKQDEGSDDDKDSDINSNGKTGTITLNPGQNRTDVDAGFYAPASLGNFVWNDIDQDGAQDAGEPGIPNVIVELYDATTSTLISTTLTNGSGNYNFTNLAPGDYYVVFNHSSVPAGFLPTLQDNTADSSDSDADPTTGESHTVSLTSGQNDDTIDAGYFGIQPPLLGSIGDTAWVDSNGDGIQDLNEPAKSGIVVELFDANTSTSLGTTITNANGFYQFTNLPAGDYYLEFTDPAGICIPTKQDEGSDDDKDSDINSNGKTGTITLNPGQNRTDVDAGFEGPKAKLGDFVWLDLDADGIQDVGESGINGLEITLYDAATSTAIATTQTNSDGEYCFDNLAAGSYYLHFDHSSAPLRCIPTLQNQGANDTIDSDPDPITGFTDVYVLAAGDTNLTIDAGYYEPAKVGDYVWYDINQDGFQDANEPGIPGVVVELYDAVTSTVIGTTMTGANGYYLFCGLLPARDYFIKFNQPNDLTNASLKDQAGDDEKDSDADPNTGETDDFTVSNDEVKDDIDAGFYKICPDGNVSIPVVSFSHAIAQTNSGVPSGNQALGSPNGVLAEIYQTTDHLILELPANAPAGKVYSLYVQNRNAFQAAEVIVSESDDNITFTPNGTYVLDGRSNIQQINILAGVTTKYIRLDLDGDIFNPVGYKVDALTCQEITYPCQDDMDAKLGDFVWLDLDADGIQDVGESGINGLEITLYDAATSTAIATTQTNSDGEYCFDNLAAGSYYLHFDHSSAPLRCIPTLQNQGANDTIDSDPDPITGFTGVYVLAAGDTNLTIDAGYYEPAKVGDYVWYDINQDGFQDANEPGIPGVVVELYDATTSTIIGTTITGVNGYYLFCGLLPARDYFIKFNQLNDLTNASPKDQGGDDEKDSDADPNTGETDDFTVSNDEVKTDIDAGFYKICPDGNVSIPVVNTSYAIGQSNSGVPTGNQALGSPNGIFAEIYQTTDHLILELPANAPAGKVYSLYVQNRNAFQAAEVIVSESDDNITFTPNGTYVLDGRTNIQQINIIAGVVTKYIRLDLDGNVFNPVGYKVDAVTCQEITYPCNSGSIGDTVWVDSNGDGIQDPNEPAKSGIVVELFDANTSVSLGTTISNANGFYQFTNLPAGNYYLEFTDPAGICIPTKQDEGSDDDKDSDINSNGKTGTITLNLGDERNDVDAGFYAPASLGDFVWNDLDQDGKQDAGEPGIPGVVVALYDANTSTLLATTATNGSGNYNFTNLAPGDYYVIFNHSSVPAGFLPTLEDNVADSSDSDADPTTGQSHVVTLTSGQNDNSIDAGYYELQQPRLGSIGDTVWIDTNGDGIQDPNEPGKGGIVVELFDGNTSTSLGTTMTNAQGFYQFTNILAGDYYLEFTDPLKICVPTKPNEGGDDNKDSDIFSNGKTGTFPLNPGEDRTDIDAGFYEPAKLGNFIFIDSDGDGSQLDGVGFSEIGIPAVKVQLFDATNVLIATTITNVSGQYIFNNLAPGTYCVIVDTSTVPFGANGMNRLVATGQDAVNDMLDSDIDNAGKTGNYTLNSGDVDLSVDAGFVDNTLPTPVELTYFRADAVDQHVHLTWQTNIEINNDRFEIERVKKLGDAPERIGLVKGAGTTNDVQDYKLIDYQPYMNESYYRLIQFDLDGTRTTGKWERVFIAQKLGKLSLKVYPNPTNTIFNIVIQGEDGLTSITLYDSRGRLVFSSKQELYKGVEAKLTLDVNQFATGTYHLKVKQGDEIQTQRIVITD